MVYFVHNSGSFYINITLWIYGSFLLPLCMWILQHSAGRWSFRQVLGHGNRCTRAASSSHWRGAVELVRTRRTTAGFVFRTWVMTIEVEVEVFLIGKEHWLRWGRLRLSPVLIRNCLSNCIITNRFPESSHWHSCGSINSTNMITWLCGVFAALGILND